MLYETFVAQYCPLGRNVGVTGLGRGGPGSFDGATVAILEALEKDLKIKTDGVQLVDGSGLTFREADPLELKGVGEPVRVFEAGPGG